MLGQEPQLIEEYEYDMIMINDPEKAAVPEKPYIANHRDLQFIKAGDDHILYFDHELKNDDAVQNLFSFRVRDGKIADKFALDSEVDFVSAVDASFGGAVYQKQGYCYFVRDAAPVSLGENVEVLPYAIDCILFLLEKQNGNQAQGDLYSFDGSIKTRISGDVATVYFANNKLYTAVSKNGKWSLLYDGKMLSEDVTGIVSDMFEMYF